LPVEPSQFAALASRTHTTRPGYIPLAVPIGLLAGSLGEKAAAAGLFWVAQTEAQIMATATAVQVAANTYRDRRTRCLALRYAIVEPTRPASHTTKPLASGAATRWQGYVALLGLGMTRSRNHTSANSPVTGSSPVLSLPNGTAGQCLSA